MAEINKIVGAAKELIEIDGELATRCILADGGKIRSSLAIQ